MRSQAPVAGLILVNAFLVLKQTLRDGAKAAPQQKIIYCFYVVSQRISPKGRLSPSAPSKNPTKSLAGLSFLGDGTFNKVSWETGRTNKNEGTCSGMSRHGGITARKIPSPCNPLPVKDFSHALTDTIFRNLKSDGTPAKLAGSEDLYLYFSVSSGKYWLDTAGKAMFSTRFSYTLSQLWSNLKGPWFWRGSGRRSSLPNEKKNIRMLASRPYRMSRSANFTLNSQMERRLRL